MKNLFIKYITEAAKLATFGALIFTMTILIYNLYAWRTGAPMVW